MPNNRAEKHHFTLTIDGRVVAIGLYDAREWPEQSSDEGELRVRIDRRWYSPAGKYTFLSPAAVGELIGRLLSDQELFEGEPAPMDFQTGQRVRVHMGECVGSMPSDSVRGFVAAPPIRGVDGRWVVPVFTPDGTNYYPQHDVEAVGR